MFVEEKPGFLMLVDRDNKRSNDTHMSCTKDSPMTWGAAEKVVCKHRRAINPMWLLTKVAPRVIQNDRNMDQKRVGSRPYRWTTGTAMRLPIPII